MDLPEILKETEVHVVKRRLKHATGGIQEYEIVNPNTHSVSAVVIDRSDNIVMVEQFRFGQNKRLLELPAGAIDTGESFEEAIRREILEETGYQGDIVEIGKHYIAAEHGVTRHVFVSLNSSKVASPSPEQSEIDEGAKVRVISPEQFIAVVRSGELTETGAAYMALDYLRLL